MRDGDGFGYFLDFGYFYHCLCLRNVIIRIIISLMLGGEYLGAGWGWVWIFFGFWIFLSLSLS